MQNARLEKNSHCVISSDNRGSDDDFSEIVEVSLGSLSDNDEDMGQDFEGFKDDDTQFYILIHWGHKASLYNLTLETVSTFVTLKRLVLLL